MENVSKALLIAAGMFLAVLLISLLVIFYNKVSHLYAQEHELKMMEQSYEFNKRFENYNRKNIRGTDLISLMNRVIDYNATESYFDGTGYERIKITIDLKGKQNEFKYYENETEKIYTYINGATQEYLQEDTITNTNNSGNLWKDDRDLVAITNTPNDLIKIAQDNGIFNITDAKLKKLSAKIYTIFAEENDTEATKKINSYNRALRAEIIEKILGIELILDEDAKANLASQSHTYIETIKYITNQYYQYTQYKRAYFDCTEVIYNPNTNRVVEMKFEVQLDNNGHIVMD